MRMYVYVAFLRTEQPADQRHPVCIPDLIQSYYLIFVIVTIGKRFRHKVDNYLIYQRSG